MDMAPDEGDCSCVVGGRKTEEAINEKEVLGLPIPQQKCTVQVRKYLYAVAIFFNTFSLQQVSKALCSNYMWERV